MCQQSQVASGCLITQSYGSVLSQLQSMEVYEWSPDRQRIVGDPGL